MHFPNFKIELKHVDAYDFIAGCDEAGMGPLAGPVVAAICILNPKDLLNLKKPHQWFSRVRDSKTVPEKERLHLEGLIKDNCLAWGIGKSSVAEIDRLNIHHARQKATVRAWGDLLQRFPKYKKLNGMILIDGKFIVPEIDSSQQAFVKGDSNSVSIAAASILAKNSRDKDMIALRKKLPEYGFEQHKGYGTSMHIEAIKKHGATKFHRVSFLKKILAEQ